MAKKIYSMNTKRGKRYYIKKANGQYKFVKKPKGR